MINREAFLEYIIARRKLLIGVSISILFLLILLLIISLFLESTTKKEVTQKETEQKSLSLSPQDVWLPSEPLPVPGVQFFRLAQSKWSAEEVKQWYTEADEESVKELQSIARNHIDVLLESVP